jgi:hypothetical protein
MNLIESNQKVQEIETSYDLLRWKIGKWCAWPILRFFVTAALANLTIDTADIKLSIHKNFQQSLHDLNSLKKGKHPQALLYVASSNRVEREDNCYKDVIFDDVLRYLYGYFKIEKINNKYYRERSQTALYPSNMTTSSILLLANILSRYTWSPGIDSITREIFSSLQKSIPNLNFRPSYIRRILTKYYWSKRIYGNLIAIIKPQLILLQVAYTNHALVAAAREVGIPVIEFQHGVIDRHHPGYSWTAYASRYKNQMIIPDRIFVYGDYWQKELSDNGFWDNELRSVGSLRIDQYRNRSIIIDHEKILAHNKAKKIIVTTQALDVERLISFIVEFLKIITTPVELFIKLHPREYNRQPYEEAFSNYSNVHIISGHEPPSTFELISMADYHVSIHSTCHYEALGLGKPTIILPLKDHERVLRLCELAPGYAVVAHSPTEMVRIVSQEPSVPRDISSYLFRDNAVMNMLDELHGMGIQTK